MKTQSKHNIKSLKYFWNQ